MSYSLAPQVACMLTSTIGKSRQSWSSTKAPISSLHFFPIHRCSRREMPGLRIPNWLIVAVCHYSVLFLTDPGLTLSTRSTFPLDTTLPFQRLSFLLMATRRFHSVTLRLKGVSSPRCAPSSSKTVHCGGIRIRPVRCLLAVFFGAPKETQLRFHSGPCRRLTQFLWKWGCGYDRLGKVWWRCFIHQ